MLNKTPSETPMAPQDGDRSRSPWDLALAVSSLAAAAIHFAVTGDHFAEHIAFGLFFVIVGWGQALWALGLLLAPRRWLILAALIGNAVVVATWVLSRTVGVPIGPEPWTPEAVGIADLVSTVLELAIVAGCAAQLALGPDRRQVRWKAQIPSVAIGVSVVFLTSVAMATVGGHSHAGSEGSTHEHAAGGSSSSHDESHQLVGGSGEPDLSQIAMIRATMKKYRDVHAAQADGWRKEHQDWPETGAHFYLEDEGAESFAADPVVDLRHPEYLMYSKFLTGKWKLVAVAYYVDQTIYPEPPTDLTGALYHEHVWNCIDEGEELEEEDWGVLSPEECEIMGGVWSPGGVWMTHVWLVDNPIGIFAETNPTLTALRF